MTHFPVKSSKHKREWVNELPYKYEQEWEEAGLIKPPHKSDGSVVRSVPFYAAQQLHRLHRIPRQLRGATKPVVVTTSKIGEPFYTPQLDFDLRTVRPLPLTYNNLLDPHLKTYFNDPAKRRVLEKRGFITSDGDVICHSMKELNQYRDFLYWNHQEMLKALRADMNTYMPKILAKRRAIAEITGEQRRYELLQRPSECGRRLRRKKKKSARPNQKPPVGKPKIKPHGRPSTSGKDRLVKEEPRVTIKDKSGDQPVFLLEKDATEEEINAATTIQAVYKGYRARTKLARGYKKKLKQEKKKKQSVDGGQQQKKIWERKKYDSMSSCHTHSCTEHLCKQFVITDLPAMMRFLKDPVAQQAYRRNYLLRLMHTPCMDISGTMVKPLLKDEIKHHSAKFRWV